MAKQTTDRRQSIIKCEAICPDNPAVLCYITPGNHSEHTGMVASLEDTVFYDWPNEDYKPSEADARLKVSAGNKKKLNEMAAKIRGSRPK